MDTRRALKILALESTACLEDAKFSFRNLAKKCHPDRFMNNEQAQKKAEAKMKDINLAFKHLSKVLKPRARQESKSEKQTSPLKKSNPKQAATAGIAKFVDLFFKSLKKTGPTKRKTTAPISSLKKRCPGKVYVWS